MNHLQILSGIQPTEVCRLGLTLPLAKHGTLDSEHILHGQLARSPDVHHEQLKSRHPFVPTASKLLSDQYKLGICMLH